MLANIAYSKIKKALIEVAGDNILIIVYGTPRLFYDQNTDLDICVYKQFFTDEEKDNIAKTVESFHVENNLKIDTDMSFKNKTAFDERDFHSLENEPPFEVVNNKLIFNDVQFTREFLDSQQMKLRLFLNIFTKKTNLIYGNCKIYNNNIIRRYNLLISYILQTTNTPITLSAAIDLVFGTTQN